jgi:hypothetical protein
MENKLGKTNFTENVDVINFLKIKKTAKISKFHSEKSKVNSQTNLLWKNQVDVGTFWCLTLIRMAGAYMTPLTLNRNNSKWPEEKVFFLLDLFFPKFVRIISC